MLSEPLLTVVIIIGILAVIGKCVEIKFYYDKFRLLKEECTLSHNTNYINYNSPLNDSI